MRYLLVTGHRYPKFYKADGSVIEVELNYVESKVFSSIDEKGKLTHWHIGGTSPCVDGHWLVDSVEEALSRLETKDVYPFISKAAAKENAKRMGLQTFKYIAVP
ncbi:conserved hypothetical protein [Vibrio chagasii]|nr:conserved hypothetical protein [Vibrio chagasii]CAH6965559.1 conserved hypothetical protein [Vibrio chagasii]